jgi:hypothetical protein
VVVVAVVVAAGVVPTAINQQPAQADEEVGAAGPLSDRLSRGSISFPPLF